MNMMDSGIPIARKVMLAGTQEIVAKRLVEGQRVSASVTSMAEADAEALLAELATLRQTHELATLTHFMVKAAAVCLTRHPRLNASLNGNEICEYAVINIGVAVSLPSGELQVVVIPDADRKSVSDIGGELRLLEQKAKSNRLALRDVRGATFTISNYAGLRHVTWSTPIIVPGQCAILGVGRAKPTLAADLTDDGERPLPVMRRVLPLSLTYDHRIVNGFPAGLFLEELAEIIEDGVKVND